MEQIRRYFEKLVPLSDKDWEIFASKLVAQEFPKKTLLLRAGQVERHLSFVEHGVIRFYIPKDESDITFAFIFANEFVSAYDSFLTQTPCSYNVETISETILWRVTFEDLQEIYATTNAGNTIGRFASEALYLEKSKREISFLDDTAEERYLKLFTEQPQLLQHIPLKYLASYIGITPQALSRIRARIS